ncbi:MAG: hypothetical protein IKV53_04985 [Clostridia bacterium]|nr:hypothetical protein [Clostridia bacterium]
MNMKKLISLTLALIMCVGVLTSLLALPVYADETETATTETTTETTEGGEGATTTTPATSNKTTLSEDYTTKQYLTMDDKLATMEVVYSNHGYDLYYHAETGEVAVKNTTTGQVLSTNPHDIYHSNNKATEKEKLLSQIIVNYVDNGEEKQMNSYASAALLAQIKKFDIRNGIRVEYTIGKSSAKRTIPFMISKERFETMILQPVLESGDTDAYGKLKSYYVLRDPNDPSLTENERQTLYNTLPATRTVGAIYVMESTVAEVERELNMFEKWILSYTKYTYDDVLKDHEQTSYTGATKTPAVFRMALEYYLTEDGLEVRLPASGIRYDSALYSLTNIQILPFFGAYAQAEEGFVLLPDGSGTLVRFEDSSESSATTITSSLYGADYSFYTQSVVANMQPWTLPVFGMVENTRVITEVWNEVQVDDGQGGTITILERSEVESYEPKGFLAVVTEGDSMMSLSTASGGLLNKYFTAFPIATPRPKDTYPLDGISVSGGTATWTVESQKKYTGSYRIKYFMLNGEEEATYVNMANVYRSYLEKTQDLKKLENDGDDIELFLETFGAIDTTERRFGVPVDVKKDLTSFENAKVMIDELAGFGINNISLKYRGWANGGLDATAPTKFKVEKVLGGKNGLLELIEYANSKNITIFPDFDYSYINTYSSGDKFSPKNDTSKTVDDRSAVHRTYDPVFQTFLDDNMLLISPNKILGFWRGLSEKFAELGTGAVSFATLGSELNSDHNKDDSLNRENVKERITEFLAEVKSEGFEVMVEQGNSYTIQYADNILNVPLDASGRYVASESVPFFGLVYHGYKNFAGDAINLAGDYTYSVLKTIENGAAPYFILSYQNANALKTSETYSKYYSIRYDIWKADLVETYQTLDMVLAPVKNSVIVGHDFITSRQVLVTYDNGTTFNIDYSTNVLIVNNGETEYTIDFETATVVENETEYSISEYLAKAGYTPYAENN